MKVKFCGFSTNEAQCAMSRWIKELCPSAELLMVHNDCAPVATMITVRDDNDNLVDSLVGTASKSAIQSFLKVTKAI